MSLLSELCRESVNDLDKESKVRTMTVNTACDREDVSFMLVEATVLA